MSHRQRPSRSIFSRKRLTTSTDSTNSEDIAILNTENSKEKCTVTKKLYSCTADTAPSAVCVKVTKLFVVGITTIQLQASSVSLKIFPLFYSLYFA